jgi:hypothetical protein
MVITVLHSVKYRITMTLDFGPYIQSCGPFALPMGAIRI